MTDEHWNWQTDRSIPSETGAGRGIQEELLREMEAAGWSRHDRFSVRLAMEEAVVNAIAHGNHYDTAKLVRVRCWLGPDLVRIEVHDEGSGFDPACVPDPTDPERLQCPCGRGLMLMRHFMTRVEHTHSGNTVVLEKRRAADSEE
ncbi:MAG: ATP-binding protein [Thermoguttaceae bacterium]|jgi:serine/threonine-protein kinase RsbW|nr:ATP-binding protein [Thermoguttaceae bacterium]